MGDIERAIRWSKRLEAALTDRHQARGRGLHELVTSVESRLDPALVRDLRYVATIRNKLVHDADYHRMDDRRAFAHRARRAARALEGRRNPLLWVVLGLVGAGFAVAVAGVLLTEFG